MNPLRIRPLTDAERETLQEGLRSAERFTVRRCQIVLASARGQTTTQIADTLGVSTQAVRNGLRAFAREGLSCLRMRSRRPNSAAKVLHAERCEQLRAVVHESPRAFGKAHSVWTLELVAEVLFERGITPWRVSDETVRQAILRLGQSWKRAKRWITSPDPGYGRKKSVGIPS